MISKEKRLEMELQIKEMKASERLRDVMSDKQYEIYKQELKKKGID